MRIGITGDAKLAQKVIKKYAVKGLFTRTIGPNNGGERLQRSYLVVAPIGLEVLHIYILQERRHVADSLI